MQHAIPGEQAERALTGACNPMSLVFPKHAQNTARFRAPEFDDLPICRLQAKFPSWDHEALLDVLSVTGNDAGKAAAMIREWCGCWLPCGAYDFLLYILFGSDRGTAARGPRSWICIPICVC